MSITVPIQHSVVWITALAVLAGCVSSTEPAGVSEEAVSEETTAVVPADEADNYVILYSGREESLVQPLIDMFSEQSGIEVDIRYAGTS
ncbi:MAG: hypothetical protein HOL65_00510, partial [Microbacteriaceae bacterium]|nr:hypothetical protein [Microbacteriaceae bacterium]